MATNSNGRFVRGRIFFWRAPRAPLLSMLGLHKFQVWAAQLLRAGPMARCGLIETRCIRRSFNLPPVPYFSPEKCFEPVNLFRCLQNKRSPCGRRRAALLVLDDTWSPFPSSSAPPPLPRGPMLRRRHGSVPRKKERLFCKAESAQLCSTLGVGGRGGAPGA